MGFEPEFEASEVAGLKRLCSSQAVVEAKLLPASGAAISKVLSIATDVSVTPSEVFTGEARYSGRVTFKIIFVDTEGMCHSMDYNADFTDKLSCDCIEAGISPIITAEILDTDIVNVDEREIKLASVVEVYLDAVIKTPVNMLVRGGEGIYTHDDVIEFSKLVSECAESFSVSDTLSDVKCTSVLLAEPRIIVSSQRAGIDSIVIDGKIICDLTCEAEEGMIVSYQTVTPFIQEISASGARDENMVIASASLSGYRVSMETDGAASAISLAFDAVIRAKVFGDAEINPVVDAFSVTNELLISGESLKVYKNKFSKVISDRVDGAVTLDINMPIADNILAVTGSRMSISSVTALDRRITLEGVVSCNIIYFSQDTNSKNSLAVELPFSLSTGADVSESDELTAKGTVTTVNTKIRRGNEIDIKAECDIAILCSSVETKYVITEISLGEERALPTSAFQIHIVKVGESLWDVAKSLGTTPEIVLLQNPKLNLPLSGGERIIAYRHLK